MTKQTHPIFLDRPEKNAKLWRYLSLSKLIFLLESKSLHFNRLDKFDDHFEGVWPLSDLQHLNNMQSFNIPSYTESMKRTQVAACCWIANENESASMWKIYSNNSEGVAIITSYEKLEKALEGSESAQGVHLLDVGKVRYIDHINDGIIKNLKPDEPLPNTLLPFMLKNISYEYEKEVRALVVAKPEFEIEEGGMEWQIEANSLINEIVINPLAPNWFIKAVEGVLIKYNIKTKLKLSTLSKKTFYQKVIPKNSKQVY